MTLTPPQRDNLNRTIAAYCAKLGIARSYLKPTDAQHIAEVMGVHIHANVPEAIAQVLSGN